LAFSTNFKALIAPAMVEGVTRLLVGTLVEISRAGVGCCSATTGAESVGAGVSAESTVWDFWAGSTFKFAGGVSEEVVAEEVELTETSLAPNSSPSAGELSRRVGKSAKANPRTTLLRIMHTS
jgi:hypothetical protein